MTDIRQIASQSRPQGLAYTKEQGDKPQPGRCQMGADKSPVAAVMMVGILQTVSPNITVER